MGKFIKVVIFFFYESFINVLVFVVVLFMLLKVINVFSCILIINFFLYINLDINDFVILIFDVGEFSLRFLMIF